MGRQTNSTTAVVQPNLFQMWSTRSQAGTNESSNTSTDDLNDTETTSEPSQDVQGPSSAGDEGAGADHPSSAIPKDSESHATGKQIVTDDIRSTQSGSSQKEEPCLSKDPSDSEDVVVLTDATGSSSVRPQSPKQKTSMTTTRKGRQRPLNGSSQLKLFPIFGKRDGQHDDISAAEPEHSNDNKEVHELRTRKKGKVVAKSDRSNFLKRTTSEHVQAPVSVQDGIFVGPSSQPLLRSGGIIELTADNDMAGPSSRFTAKGSQEEPIVIDSSPVRDVAEHSKDDPLSPRKPRRPFRNGATGGFFAPRALGSSVATTRPRRKVGEGELANWPSKDSQHVRGAQRSFTRLLCDSLRLRTEPRRDDPSTSLADSISHLRCSENSYPKDEPRYLVEPVRSQRDGHAEYQDVRHSNASCPAISRFPKVNDDASNTWNDKWRPRRALEVIGNSESALYLRDWLVTLEIKPEEPTEVETKVTAGVRDKFSQGTKRPQVIRAVDKPRKRRKKADSDEDSLGDWITSDDEEEYPLAFDCEEEDSDGDRSDGRGSPWRPRLTRLSRRRPSNGNCPDKAAQEPASAPAPTPTPTHDFSDRLTNAILLVGPTGSGKTATVYACAEELGWEVFEVYPGIGRRNGTSLVSLVGDVGKNHIVNRSSRGFSGTHGHIPDSNVPTETPLRSKQDRRKPASKAFAPFFVQNGKDSSRNASCGVSNSEYKDGNFDSQESIQPPSSSSIRIPLDSATAHGRLPTPFENSDSRHIGAQQSIILLEEVDILFAEDINFWPTVVALIRESRRPIIMTCNDSSLVPADILPLQTILSFDPCPPDLAITYLQHMALTEGYTVSEKHVKSLYGCNSHLDVLDTHSDLVRSSVRPTSPPDLRHTINSLQFLCQGSPGLNSNSNSLSSSSNVLNRNLSDDSVLNDLSNWNWNQYPMSDTSFPSATTEQAEIERESARRIRDLWRVSDSLSMINSCLARSPLALLETHSYATGSSLDLEIGYPRLDCETDILHLQDGIPQYNYDEAIALEALRFAGRTVGNSAAHVGPGTILDNRTEEGWKATTTELLLKRTEYFARVSGVLEKIVSLANRQSVDSLVLDYEPWVRQIDRSDMDTEAAMLKESETRRGGARGGRSTRNSQRVQYQRYFDLDEGIRAVWHAKGIGEKTGCGEGEF